MVSKQQDSLFDDPCTPKRRDHEVVGVVTSGSLGELALTGTPIPLPLTSPVLVTDGVRVSPTGGVIVEESGEYLVSFGTSILEISLTGGLSVYADSRFLGNVGPLSAIGLGTFAEIVTLKKGDLVQVVANGPLTAGVLQQGMLSVAKLG